MTKLQTKNSLIVKNVFLQASEFIDLIESKKFNYNDEFSVIPIYVNSLFAIELLLKAILLYDGIELKKLKEKTHHLKELYELLSEKRKHDINTWMKSFYLTNILELLDKVNDDYVKARYKYLENNHGIKMTNLHTLCQFMYKLQLELSNELFGYDYYKKMKCEK